MLLRTVSLTLLASASFAYGQGPGGEGGGGRGPCAMRGESSSASTLMGRRSTGSTTETATTAAALLGASTSSSALASRTAQLERQLAVQQAYLLNLQQQMALQQQSQAAAQQANQAKSDRQSRLRRSNAEKALAAAQRAEFSGNSRVARRQYQRVIELASADDSLAREARESLGRLDSSKAPLVAANGR